MSVNIQFKEIHPFVSFFYYGCTGISIMLLSHPLFLITAILVLVSLNILQGTKEKLLRSLPHIAGMGMVIALLNPLFVRRGSTILFYFRNNPVTLEAVVYGVVMAMSLVCIFILFISFNEVIHGRKFLYLFSKILPQLALLLVITLRFVPLFIRRWKELYDTQKLRNYSMFKGSIKNRSQTGMLYMQKLLTWSMEEALQTAESMNARGFGGKGRSHYQLYNMSGFDWGAVFFLIIFTATCMWGAGNGLGALVIYPELGSIPLTQVDWMLYGVFTLLIGFPILLEGGMHIRWHILNSTK
jgi:energy-coupling factor transport system permease protein